MRIPVVSAEIAGVIKDLPPHELPMEAFSDITNMRAQDGALQKFLGHTQAFVPTVDPYWLLPVRIPTDYFWMYPSSAKVYVVTQSTGVSTDITRTVGGDYTGGYNKWTGAVLNGIPVISDGVDIPQQWSPPNTGTPLAALANWPATYKCGSIRAFKNFLVALDITKGSTRYPTLVKWSHPADPGAVPVSWDETDATRDAGEAPISESLGDCIDSLGLGNYHIIYKQDSAYSMEFIGGVFVFKFTRILKASGILARNCARSFYRGGEMHAVFGVQDIYMHDGRVAQSIVDERMRKWVYANMDKTNLDKCFVTANPFWSEIWFCFPLTGSTLPNIALVWNYTKNTLSFRDLPLPAFIENGTVSPILQPDIWSGDSAPWSSDVTLWGEASYTPQIDKLLMAIPGGGGVRNLYMADAGNQFDATSFFSRAERVGLTIAGIDRYGKSYENLDVLKQLNKIWPRIEAPAGSVIQIYAASQMERNDPIVWQGPFNFTVGTDAFVCPLLTGRLLGVKFQATGNFNWKLYGYDLEIVARGSL